MTIAKTIANFVPKQTITMTDSAIEKTRKELEKKAGIGLRVAVKTSGCSGYMYVLDIANEINDDDKVFKITKDVSVVVDRKSLPILMGTEIDYVKDGINELYQFNNPNAQSQCGCGESFTVNS